MTTPRFIIRGLSSITPSRTEARICGEELHHLARVLRMKVGDVVEVADGKRSELLFGIIRELNQSEAVIEVTGSVILPAPPIIRAYVGLGERASAELVVEKLTELGISEISFFIAARTQGGAQRKDSKVIERWERIAAGAVKQSKQISPPTLSISSSLSELLSKTTAKERETDPALKCVAVTGNEIPGEIVGIKNLLQCLFEGLKAPENLTYLAEDGASRSELEQITTFADSTFVVGPEGGLSEDEVKIALSSGFQPVSLGTSILRVETAAILIGGLLRLYCSQK